MPVAKTIALGGVETGRKSAQDAQRPMVTARLVGSIGLSTPANGISTVAAAVLLMILEKRVVPRPKMSKSVSKIRTK